MPGDAAMLARIWARADRYACDEGMDFFSSGGSSLDLIHLIADVEDVFGVALASRMSTEYPHSRSCSQCCLRDTIMVRESSTIDE